MRKILKVGTTVAIALVITLTSAIAVHAAGNNYPSSISISDNSQFSGKERKYSYNNYRLDITPTSMTEGPLCPGEVQLGIKLIRPLYRLTIKYGTETKYSGTTIFKATDRNKKKSIYSGNCGDGKRYYHFSTAGEWGAGYGALSGNANIYNYS